MNDTPADQLRPPAHRLSRRHFVASTAALAAAAPGAVAFPTTPVQDSASDPPNEEEPAQDATNEQPTEAISTDTIREAEKALGLSYTDQERQQMLQSIRQQADMAEHRATYVDIPNGLSPIMVFQPRIAGARKADDRSGVALASSPNPPLPGDDETIAFAPVTALSHWLHTGQLTSTRLTNIYLDRIRRLDDQLEAIITVTDQLALAQAAEADRELSLGLSRGPLHGIPYGAKDLFDTAGIRTTWGATPYQNRVATEDAFVIRRLREAGAVLIAKTTLGALAYGDIWFGGRTNNPWNLNQGSSGSSAGSASGTAAGLFGFSLGTETYGSIVSPCMRCGTTGLRPTFGRVARTGAMALCWSLDKIGPICRSVEDTMLVLDAINGRDDGDLSSENHALHYDGNESLEGMRVGFDPSWFDGRGATPLDQAALDHVRALPVEVVEIDMACASRTGPLLNILQAEAAAAFAELTLTDRDDELVWQAPQAWPNSFRATWMTSAVDLIESTRLRHALCQDAAEAMRDVDAIVGPSFAGGMLAMTNMTGHPSLTLRSGFRSQNRPHGFTIWGHLDDEGTIVRLGRALEARFGVADARPPLS